MSRVDTLSDVRSVLVQKLVLLGKQLLGFLYFILAFEFLSFFASHKMELFVLDVLISAK